MINFHHGLNLAMAVYHLYAVIAEEFQKTILVEAYQNGREQGLAFWNLDANKAVYVSNDRHSDQLVIYTGSISMQGLTDELYATKKYFTNVQNVVDYLLETL